MSCSCLQITSSEKVLVGCEPPELFVPCCSTLCVQVKGRELCRLWSAWLSTAVLPVSPGSGHHQRYPAPRTHCQPRAVSTGGWLRSSTAATALAALQAHFHSRPGLGAPLILLDKTQHGSGFDWLLSQVQLSSHSLASSASHCYTPNLHGFEACLQKL